MRTLRRSARARHRASALFAVGIAILLSACGGGGAPSGLAPPTPDSQSLLTLPQYLAERGDKSYIQLLVAPDPSEVDRVGAATQKLAIAQIQADPAVLTLNAVPTFPSSAPPSANFLVAPALTAAFEQVMRGAAQGGTLDQIKSNLDPDLSTTTAFNTLSATSGVERQLWVQRDKLFELNFFQSTDSTGALTRLAAWDGAQTSFNDGGMETDQQFQQGLADFAIDVSKFSTPRNIRALITDRIKLSAAWPSATPFTGRFDSGTQHQSMPMIRVSGAVRLSDPNFVSTAIGLPDSGYTVLTIQPTSETLAGFATTHLATALAQSLNALVAAGSTGTMAADLVLPEATLSLRTTIDRVVSNQMSLAYNVGYADLRGLDGVGGTYVQTQSADSALDLRAEGISLRASHAFAFTFSPQNIYADNSGTPNISGLFMFSSTTQQITAPPTCPSTTADLAPFYLVIVDQHRAIVAMAAISELAGASCQ